jgi:hypothetical protein
VGAVSDDITDLILDDHDRFRRAFAELDTLQRHTATPATDAAALRRVWAPLAALLDLHAVAEEQIFYPKLLLRGDAGEAEDETLDAIGDHNDIRDAVHDAAGEPVASDAWWAAVGRARVANDEHMAEEEREALADFRRNSPPGLRDTLGRRFRRFKQQHPGARGLDTSDREPEQYVREEVPGPAGPRDTSLGIGSLKGN